MYSKHSNYSDELNKCIVNLLFVPDILVFARIGLLSPMY